jgi:hypothetical protein
MATVVALVSDLHCNSSVALSPPIVELDDGGQYRASKPQRWLWRQWLAYWQQVAERRAGQRLVVVLNGELADDNHHPTTQLVTRNPADMLKLSVEVLRPVLGLIQEGDAIIVTRGTEAHSGPSAHLDETIAQDIGAAGPDSEIASHWRLRMTIDGVRFDVAHHPPGGGGRLPWTRGGFANRLAAMSMFEAAERGERPPHFLVRGHVHRPDDSYDRFPVRALVLPSWQLTTSYGHRIGGDPLPIGGAIVTCDAGRAHVEKIYADWPVEGYRTI